MLSYRQLPGLPVYGPPAINFSDTGFGKHSEGFVVEFFPEEDRSWVGNFHRGMNRYDQVIPHSDGSHLIVVSGGSAYVVDPANQTVLETFGAGIEFCVVVDEPNIFVLGMAYGLSSSSAMVNELKPNDSPGMECATSFLMV